MVRLLEMRIWQNRLEGISILTLQTMTKSKVSSFQKSIPFLFSRYSSPNSLLCFHFLFFLSPSFGVMGLVTVSATDFYFQNGSQEVVAKEFGIPVQFQRFWFWTTRQNFTYRLHRPLTPEEESQTVFTYTSYSLLLPYLIYPWICYLFLC